MHPSVVYDMNQCIAAAAAAKLIYVDLTWLCIPSMWLMSLV